MFKNTYQNGLLSIFYSCGSNPLTIWDSEVQNGHIKRLTDNEVNSIVLEIVSSNVATTFISCPRKNQVLGIQLPFLVIIVKNLKRYFSFEITILDDKNMRRRFRISNFQSTTKIKPFCTSMPIGLSGGWNQVQFNLADFTKRAYGTQFLETLRVQVHANCRLRRIYFSDRLYKEEELPQDYKLYLPLEHKKKVKPEVKISESEKQVAPKKAAKEETPPPAEPAKVEAASPGPVKEEPEVSPPRQGSPAGDATPVEVEATAKTTAEPAPETQAETEGETPVENPQETPAEAATETPVEVPVEAPAEAPVEAPVETAAETQAEISAESPAPDTLVNEAPTAE